MPPSSGNRPILRFVPRLAIVFACGVVAAGVAASFYWFARVDGPDLLREQLPSVILALGVTAAVLLVNIGLRWLRWHFLLRRTDVLLPARDSLLIFLGTLPAVLTPFYLGELVRATWVGKRHPGLRLAVARVWLLERSTDLVFVTAFLTLARGDWRLFGAAGVAWGVVAAGLRAYERSPGGGVFPSRFALGATLLLSAPISLLPPVTLWWILHQLGNSLGFVSTLGSYAHSTLLGTLSGLPLGISVTGSSLVLQLEALGLGLPDAVSATWVFRIGTVWFAVAFGALVAVAFRGELLAMLRPAAQHFDSIAEAYEGEIPTDVSQRLVERKTRAMRAHLEAQGSGVSLRGLDLGCGPGWYAIAMARAGHRIEAVDASAGQLATTLANASRAGIQLAALQSEAERLPFSDASFDFAYSINVFHHIQDEVERQRALAEIVRVLRPGGTFFLQEINTENPAFRFYMNYVFPVVRAIDEGTEQWISPRRLPATMGAEWESDVDYFTFLPDFLPRRLRRMLGGLEAWLEDSSLRELSAHYVARLVRDASDPPLAQLPRLQRE